MTDEELRYIKALQPLFKKVMGEWQDADWFLYKGRRCFVNNQTDRRLLNEDTIRIPPPIDQSGQGRDLWSMVDWNKYVGEIMPNGKLWIMNRKRQVFDKITFEVILPPTLALLKAIAAQEGITL